MSPGRDATRQIPDPPDARKNRREYLIRHAQAHPAWVVGFADEVGRSRVAPPHLHAWTDTQPLGLVSQATDKHDPEPKALACDGLRRTDINVMRTRFVDGRPVSRVTTQLHQWLAERLAEEGTQAVCLQGVKM